MQKIMRMLLRATVLSLLISPDSLALNSPQPLSLPNSSNIVPVAENSQLSPLLLSTAFDQYQTVIRNTVSMVSDPRAQELARKFGLNILDITWEDTGRYQNSAVGPNISDMTIQVQQRDPRTNQYRLSLMPVIRYPNFSDQSADVRLDQFFLLVGNEKDQPLRRVSLKEFLGNLRRYLNQPDSWRGRRTSLLADRDTHVLVSAQACFLPVPQGDKAQFNPVLFNYQSYPNNPAVLTILATREGTSVTIIDNARDGFDAGRTWGQRLFFNKDGERASFTGERISDFHRNSEDRGETNTPQAGSEAGLNMVMLIQVPLKQKDITRSNESDGFLSPSSAAGGVRTLRDSSDVEAAVIGHGEIEGPFTEIDGIDIERDPRFPIRVTVQFYKATSNGVVSEQDMREIQQQIAKVYDNADYVGSLVIAGDTNRPTEYDGPKQEPPGWWDDFWRRYEATTGQSREDAIEMLRRLRGQNWMPRSEQELKQVLEQVR